MSARCWKRPWLLGRVSCEVSLSFTMDDACGSGRGTGCAPGGAKSNPQFEICNPQLGCSRRSRPTICWIAPSLIYHHMWGKVFPFTRLPLAKVRLLRRDEFALMFLLLANDVGYLIQ